MPKPSHDIALTELRIRRKALEDTILTAPFDGIVVKRYVENHEHVEAGQAHSFFSGYFSDRSGLCKCLNVSSPNVEQQVLKSCRSILMLIFTLNVGFTATVYEYKIESDKVTQSYDVVVGLAPPPDLNIFPGMTATIRALIANSVGISPPTKQLSKRIPVEALWRGNNGKSYVWIINPAGGSSGKKTGRGCCFARKLC